MLKVYSYSGCDSCRKALAYLRKQGAEFEDHAIVETPPSKAELKRMLGHLDGELKRLFNTSGQLYREMKISQKLAALSEADALTLLSKHGKLIKRPFILGSRGGTVGFHESELKKLI